MRFVSVLIGLTALAASLLAAPERLNYGKQLNAAQCNGGGQLVINVVQRVVNNADSGVTRPVWAFDEFTRQIQVWQTGPHSFCATVKYHGSFVTLAGDSPMGTGTIDAGIEGTLEGGYTAPITGTLKAVPGARTKGNIGTIDYACDELGNCPGAAFWADLYFETGAADFTFDQPWWGWIYHGGKNGTWVNASSGNSGDIHN